MSGNEPNKNMPSTHDSIIEIRLGKDTLCVLAFARREDGSFTICGMQDIIDGSFISTRDRKSEKAEPCDTNLIAFEMQETSSLAARGGEMFVINRTDLKTGVAELGNLLLQLAGKKTENLNNEV